MILCGGVVGDNKVNKGIIMLIVIVILTAAISMALFLHEDYRGSGRTPHMSRVVVDSNNNIHVLWLNIDEDSTMSIYYTKFNSNFTYLIEPRKLFDNPPNVTVNRFDIAIDQMDCIHILYGELYAKIDVNGNVITQDIILNSISLYPEYPIIKLEDGELVFLGRNGVVDSENNVHIISFKEILKGNVSSNYINYTKITPDGSIQVDKQIGDFFSNYFSISVDSINNLHLLCRWGPFGQVLHYAKLDNNGNILINFTEIDTTFDVEYFDVVSHLDHIHVVCSGYTIGAVEENATVKGDHIYYFTLDSTGHVVIPARLISTSTARWPSISSNSEGNIVVSYETTANNTPIYCIKIDQDGNNIGEIVEVKY